MSRLTMTLAGGLLVLAVAGAVNNCAMRDASPRPPAAPSAIAGRPVCTPDNSVADFFAGDCVEPAPDPAKPYPTTELDKSDGGRMPDFLPGGFEVMCDPAHGAIQELRPDTPDTRAKAAKECAR